MFAPELDAATFLKLPLRYRPAPPVERAAADPDPCVCAGTPRWPCSDEECACRWKCCVPGRLTYPGAAPNNTATAQ